MTGDFSIFAEITPTMSSLLHSLFLLNPDITYLNFGSFGACPKEVFDDYQKWQLELETEPVQFFATNGPSHLKNSRSALAQFINAPAEDLIFTPNPTYAINAIANSIGLKPGDEILSTNLEYGALDRAWNFHCKKHGATFIRQSITLPIADKETFVAEFIKGFSEKTKAIFISHITSVTGIILPVKEICEAAKERGVMTIVDGAHVPGHVKLDLAILKADVYTGACHKWMMTPKGCTFLYVTKSLQHSIDPLVVSWGYESDQPGESQFFDYHQFNGTRDYSAYLTVPAAIRFMEKHNWNQVSDQCRSLVRSYAPRFATLSGMPAIAPVTEEFLGQMFSIPVTLSNPQQFQKMLFSKYKIEVPVMVQNGRVFIRYSINGFNDATDLDHLYRALEMELTEAK